MPVQTLSPDIAAELAAELRRYAEPLPNPGHHDFAAPFDRFGDARIVLLAQNCERDMAIVPGAGHLFEEPGTLDQVVELASSWFLKYLRGRDGRSR